MIINSIVSCITKKHHDVWKYTSVYLNKYIKAENYYVISPSHEVNLLKDITPKNFFILNEEDVIPLKYKEQGFWTHRWGGWIYQQFLKIEAASVLGPRVLIWDGDTVPLKNMENIFFPTEECVQVFTGEEYHEPYFQTLKHLLHLPKRLVDFSFIAQCLPIYSQDINVFKIFLKTMHKIDWKDAITHSLKCSKTIDRFSEYETLGNFILQQNLRKIITFNGSWERNGWEHISCWEDINNLTEKDMYFCSFEQWQRPQDFKAKLTEIKVK